MPVFSKELRDTDVRFRFSFPTGSLGLLNFGESNFVDLNVEDSSGERRVIRCRKREGRYAKPVLSVGWLQFVADYNLRVGDKVVLLRDNDRRLEPQFRIEAKKRIILFGEEVWVDVPRAN